MEEYTIHNFQAGDELKSQDFNDMDNQIALLTTDKVDVEEGKGLSTNDYTTDEKNKLAGLSNYDDTSIKERVSTVENKIPSQASSTNQLADKDFVNSSITTATATFKGSFTSLDELKKTSADTNDYAFYVYTDTDGKAMVDRYKYSTEWVFEYNVNNSGLTDAQLKATLSGITAELVAKLNGIDDSLNLKTADHKSNETALVFTDASGTETTVYVHTTNA